MNSSIKKPKPTLKSLLDSQQLITGKKLIQQEKAKEDEAKRQKAIIDEAIEFEMRNRRKKRL